jgi:hypothetical protein
LHSTKERRGERKKEKEDKFRQEKKKRMELSHKCTVQIAFVA